MLQWLSVGGRSKMGWRMRDEGAIAMPDKIVAKSLRRLDTLVAEKVFGWKVVLSPRHKGWGIESEQDGETVVNGLPDFSSDISAAWDLLEQFYSATVDKESGGKRYRAYVVTERDGANADGAGYGDTAPIAICLAVLRAEGVDVEF